ncbi:putative membrane protein [Flavobacterium sp. CG_9.1]|uniref:Uncharacterized protein n=1 Tax=Flavobacterium fryxellicola TaxID=249352 RepID=A0A167UP18_9FLAO|nr:MULTISPECIES: DUF5808 domain-containing protein [Flavobacterium]MBG6061045.1 putative membrane protein [Flavobacterium sp. CG_9.1]OAB25747.1 hypothetical protein FBFR_14725 [Flavobacterium fryxellicola]SHN74436.1 hypothetical protein SAMN05444395_108155 [Flavobacterium fryxellicola]
MSSYQEPSKETSDRWKNDPKNWVWGIFYYNKEDPRILPPKKVAEMGFTINFANPKSVLIFLAALAFFAMVVFFISNKR